MKKRKKGKAFLLFFIAMLMIFPARASAAGLIDTQREVSLTLHCQYGGRPISQMHFRLYEIAGMTETAEVVTKPPFGGVLPDMTKLTGSEWKTLAQTLLGIVQKNNIPAADSGDTDQNGILAFPQKSVSLSQGLYLVVGDNVKQNGYTYTTAPFLVFLPTEDVAKNIWEYAVMAYPKYSRSTEPVTPPPVTPPDNPPITPPDEPPVPDVPDTTPEEPQEPEKTSEVPKTGDSSLLPLWIGLCTASLVEILGLLIYKKKKKV